MVGIYYNSIDPLMGMVPGIKAFVAAVLGGIGIIPGAMLGGIILGVVEAMVSGGGGFFFAIPINFFYMSDEISPRPPRTHEKRFSFSFGFFTRAAYTR